MKKLFPLMFFFAQALIASAQFRVEVPEVVSLDEQFNVTFVYEGDDSPSSLDWNPGDNFRLVWGPQQGRSTRVQIINGKRTKSSQYTYTYILMPKASGDFEIPEAVLKVKGNELRTKGAPIKVVSQSSSSSAPSGSASSGQRGMSADVSDGDIFLRLTLDKSRATVGEPVSATLKLYQRVNIAGFEDARFPSFEGFWSQEVEAPVNIEFRREALDDKIYNTAVLRKYVLIPQKSGNLVIDPAELVCLVNVRTVSSGSVSMFDEFFDEYRTVRKRVRTAPVTLKVSALPAGAPDSYKGGVGQFSISARLSKDSLTTHEAASLLITIKGKGNISLLEAPDVVFPPDFEVYDTKSTEHTDKLSGGTSGSKVYEYPFIPRSPGDFAIAPVKYTYFDVTAGKYVTVETPAIPFTVKRGGESEQTGSSAVLPGVSKRGVKNLNEDIRFINTKDTALYPKGHFFAGSTLFWILCGLVLVISAVMWGLYVKVSALRSDVVGTRNRQATKMARKRLSKASEYLKQSLYSAFYEELHKALMGYVSDKLNIPVSDLSREKIAEAFSSAGIEPALVDSFMNILDACEFARYSPASGNDAMSSNYDEAVNVISSIDSNMKNKKTGSVLPMIIAALLVFPAAANAADPYVDSLFNAANDSYVSGDWEKAVSVYGTIEKMGLESPALYCNTANALFKSGNYARAILYYERALRLDPSYSDARYNRAVVSVFIQDRIEPVPEFVLKTWTRDLCYLLPSDIWASGAILFLLLTCVSLLFLFLSSSLPVRRISFSAGIVCFVLLCMTLSFAFWQKSDYMRKDAAIIMAPVVSVKSSPSEETSKDLFVLHEGTKVVVIDEVGEWRNVELADGRQGWMRSEEMEII